jgi:hypothetical protein
MFANCSLMGMHFGFPDVCLTPALVPVPIPYPNIAMLPTAIPPTTSMRHMISMLPAHTLSSMVPLTLGDQPGVLLGVASGMVMGPARNTLGSFKVLSGGMPQTKMLSMSMHNSTNCPIGMTLVPSQFKVLIMM